MGKKKGKKKAKKPKKEKEEPEQQFEELPASAPKISVQEVKDFEAFNFPTTPAVPVPVEPPAEPVEPAEPEVPHGSLSFLEEALKKTHDHKTTLESFMLEKVEIQTEEPEFDESELIPQLKSEAVPAEAETPEQIQSDLGDMAQALAALENMEMEAEEQPTEVAAPAEQEWNLNERLTTFFEELIGSFSERYQRWENSVGLILTILRKMRKITKKNTEQLISSIEQSHQTTKDGLFNFEIKRKEIEKISGSNFTNISKEFRKILGLLELQVQEYTLKKSVSELFYRSYT